VRDGFVGIFANWLVGLDLNPTTGLVPFNNYEQRITWESTLNTEGYDTVTHAGLQSISGTTQSISSHDSPSSLTHRIFNYFSSANQSYNPAVGFRVPDESAQWSRLRPGGKVKTPLPTPTDTSSNSGVGVNNNNNNNNNNSGGAGASAGALDGTDISRVTDESDQTPYSIPEDGSPMTIPTHRRREGADRISRESHPSHTTLLIEYFEGGKESHVESRRPSVRVKVTPSSRKSKGRSGGSGGHRERTL
jgi:hypothetical protein